jgi:hypothetical protein
MVVSANGKRAGRTGSGVGQEEDCKETTIDEDVEIYSDDVKTAA